MVKAAELKYLDMATLSDNILENSIQAVLAAIETYNKPDFKYREQTFTVLLINAWELLLKAKILADNSDDVESIYIRTSDGSFKTNRSGNFLTIEVISCLKKCGVSSKVGNNVEQLTSIRYTAIHYYHDTDIKYIVYILGVASLKNFQRLINEWFGRSLLEFNFYIMPLAFAYNFQTLSSVDIDKKLGEVGKIIDSVVESQKTENDDDGFYFIREIKTSLVSVKAASEANDFTTKIDANSAGDKVLVKQTQRITDVYPLSYKEMIEKVKKQRPNAKQGDIDALIKTHNLKNNRGYSDYAFRNKAQSMRFLNEGILRTAVAVIYNNEAVKFIVENLP